MECDVLKRLTLNRKYVGDQLTTGELLLGTRLICYTMEPGEDDVDAPRIPPGFYYLERHDNPKFTFKDTWAFIGKGLTHQPRLGYPRAAVLFHGGNRDQETRGCVLTGTTIAYTKGGKPYALIRSQDALNLLRSILGVNNALIDVNED